MLKRPVLVVVLSLYAAASASALELDDLLHREPRSRLEEHGLSLEVSYFLDMAVTASGGLNANTTWLDLLDLEITYDMGKAGLIPGGRIFVSANDTRGGDKPTVHHAGDLQGVDNIEARDAFRFYEAWYEQGLFQDRLAVLAGAHALDSEFAITEYGALFINGSLGTPPDLSANVPLSIFPSVGPAVRIKIRPDEKFEFLYGLYDGDPSDNGKNHHNTGYRLSKGQGLLNIFEAAYRPVFLCRAGNCRGPSSLVPGFIPGTFPTCFRRMKMGSRAATAVITDFMGF